MHRPDTAIRTGSDVETQTHGSRNPPVDLPEPRLTENARTVLTKRYLKKNEELEPIETPKRHVLAGGPGHRFGGRAIRRLSRARDGDGARVLRDDGIR